MTRLLLLSLLAAPVSDSVVIPVLGEISERNLTVPTALLTMAPPGAAITVVFDSPGGSVGDGMVFAEALHKAQARGVRVTCFIPPGGMAASMAAYLFEQCDRRVMHRRATLLFHSVSVGILPGGTVDDVERAARALRDVNDLLAVGILARLRISRAEYAEKVRGDWWLGWEEAVEVGATDEVVE